MSDLKKYIEKRKQTDAVFALNFDEGYQAFKMGILLKLDKFARLLGKSLEIRLS
jgi:hypothetical protein